MNPAIGLAWNPAVGIPMLFVGIVVLVLLWLFGQPRKEQGRRKPVQEQPERARERREPVFGDERDDIEEEGGHGESFSARDEDANDPLFNPKPAQGELDVDLRAELERLGASLAGERSGVGRSGDQGRARARSPSSMDPRLGSSVRARTNPLRAPRLSGSSTGARSRAGPRAAARPRRAPTSVAVHRMRRSSASSVFTWSPARAASSTVRTSIVAAEKAGLEFGDMGIYHRLVDGHPEQGPIFSVANLTKPGNFDMARIATLQTAGLSFFMALAGPVSRAGRVGRDAADGAAARRAAGRPRARRRAQCPRSPAHRVHA